jgi:hypothetical protein
LVAAANNKTLTGADDGKTGVVFSMVDLDNDNSIAIKSIATEKFIGDRTTRFVGIQDIGNGQFYTSVLLTAPEGSTAASTDSVYIAKMNTNLEVLKIYESDKLSYSASHRQSALYSQIGNDANGNTYVFSGSHTTTTTKKAGALRINKGADDFDAGYYFDIEAAADGYRFKRLWHMGVEDYFLLEFYNEKGAAEAMEGAAPPANRFAVLKMSDKKFTWVTGMPELSTITSAGWAYTHGGKGYMMFATANTNPTVYVISKDGVAKKGVSVSGISSIASVARLSPQENIN